MTYNLSKNLLQFFRKLKFKILKKIKGIQLEKWYIVRLADTIQITTEETKNKGLMLNFAPTVIMKQLDLNRHF